MGTVSDIIDGIGDILQSIIDKGLAKLLEVLISGFTLVFSAPTITLATLFNDKPGFVDPLLMPPAVCYEQRLELLAPDSSSLLDVTVGDLSILYPRTGELNVSVRQFQLTVVDAGLACTVQGLSLV